MACQCKICMAFWLKSMPTGTYAGTPFSRYLRPGGFGFFAVAILKGFPAPLLTLLAVVNAPSA